MKTLDNLRRDIVTSVKAAGAEFDVAGVAGFRLSILGHGHKGHDERNDESGNLHIDGVFEVNKSVLCDFELGLDENDLLTRLVARTKLVFILELTLITPDKLRVILNTTLL